MTETIPVTDPEFAKGQPVFENCEFDIIYSPRDEAPLAELVVKHGCRAAIVGVDHYTGPLYDALAANSPQGAIIARFGVGHDGVDKTQAAARKIVVTNTPGVLDISVAEHAIGLMTSLTRHIVRLDEQMRKGQFATIAGAELEGKTLAVLGFGPIGRRVAKIASLGFGMNVIAVDILSHEQLESNLDSRFEDISFEHGLSGYVNTADEILPHADVVSIHMPAVPDTHHFIDVDRLAMMKRTALLINTSRGSLVDESALFDALESATIAGAALDVFQKEPYVPVTPEKDLRTLSNVVLTSHVGSNTVESNARMATSCLKNIRHFFAGELDQLTQVS